MPGNNGATYSQARSSALGLPANLGGLFVPPIESLAGRVIGYDCPWAIARLHPVLTGREGIGQSDINSLAALGLWLGWRGLFWAALIATLAALILVLGAGLARRKDGLDRLWKLSRPGGMAGVAGRQGDAALSLTGKMRLRSFRTAWLCGVSGRARRCGARHP